MHEPLPTDGADRRPDTDLNVILLVGNQVLERGLETLLWSLDRVSDVRIAKPEKLQEDLASTECDVILVDTGSWSLLGTAVEDVSLISPPRILVIGDFPFESHTDKFTSLPSDGFLALSGISTDLLDDVLQRVISGDVPMPAQLARRLLMRETPMSVGPNRNVRLTAREHETLLLLADGLSNKQIARRLGISTHGAKRLVGAVLLKLGSPNRTAAVVTAMKIGIVGGAGSS